MTFSSPSWRSLNPLKGSRFHHPRKGHTLAELPGILFVASKITPQNSLGFTWGSHGGYRLAGVVENVGWLDVIMNDPATTDLNIPWVNTIFFLPRAFLLGWDFLNRTPKKQPPTFWSGIPQLEFPKPEFGR